MPNDNRISAELSAVAVTAVRDAIAVIRTNLPFLVSLSTDERRTLPKLGDNRLALDEDAHALRGGHPDDVPALVSLPELEKDRTLRAQLDDIRLALEALHDDVEGTEMVLGSEMLMAYLAFYANAQQGAKRGAVGSQAAVSVPGKYFARTPKPAASRLRPTRSKSRLSSCRFSSRTDQRLRTISTS